MLSSGADSERLGTIEKLSDELLSQQAQLDAQYQQERELTQTLLEVRQDLSRQSERAAIQQQLSEIQGNQPLLSLDVDVRTVANVIADWTGVPLGSLLKDEQTSLLQLEDQLGERVIGQPAALGALAQRLRAAKPV